MADLHQGFKVPVAIVYTKADGTSGTVEGMPVWSLVPETLGVVTVAADGMSADVAWAGSGDNAVLTITADGDLGTGIFPIVNTVPFNFVAPLGAVAGAVTVGAEVSI
jgi:hypothetical protein